MCEGPAACGKRSGFNRLEEEAINNLKSCTTICRGLFMPVMYWIEKQCFYGNVCIIDVLA